MTTNNKPSNKMNKEEKNLLNYLSNNKPSEPVSEVDKYKYSEMRSKMESAYREIIQRREYQGARIDDILKWISEYADKYIEQERAKVKDLQALLDEAREMAEFYGGTDCYVVVGADGSLDGFKEINPGAIARAFLKKLDAFEEKR